MTGTFIASYTLWDKYAVSTLKVPPLIQGYASLPVMALVLAPSALRQRERTARVWRRYRRQVTGAAVLSPLAYILVLIAMSFTAVSAVAPAREVSVLAGVVLGRRLLGEGSLARRLAGSGGHRGRHHLHRGGLTRRSDARARSAGPGRGPGQPRATAAARAAAGSAAAIRSTASSSWAADTNHASNGDGGR